MFSWQVYALEEVTLTVAQLNDKTITKIHAGDFKEAYRLALKAKHLAKTSRNEVEYSRAISNLASCLYYLGDNEEALSLYREAMLISQSNNDFDGVRRILNNIAGIYAQIGNKEESLKYRIEQYKNVQRHGDKKKQLSALIGLSQSYAALGNLVNAKKFLLLAKEIFKKTPDVFLGIYLSLAETHILTEEKKYTAAENIFKQVLNIATEHEYKSLIADINIDMANMYYQTSRLKLAELEAKNSIQHAKSLEFSVIQLDGHLLLIKIYSEQKRYEEALEQTKIVNQMSVQISGEKVKLLGEIIKINREVTATEEKLKQFQQEQTILSLQLERQQQRQVIWLALLGVFFIAVFFLYYRITSKKEIVRQRALNKQLEELDTVKDRVLTNTSHELRTPLNGIIGLSEFIIQDDENGMSQATLDAVKLIKLSGEQLALVINDILEMSKLKNSKVTIINTEFKLNDLVTEVVMVCKPLADEKGIGIGYQESPNIPLVTQDRGRVRQILFNVIGNAVKFTLTGKVKVVAKANDNEMVILVTDTGIGIPSNKMERIFKGFEQVDASDSRAQSGSGLGLAISRSLSEALGGNLTLTSKLNQGTQVIIRLPQIKMVPKGKI